jgi:hypothetical protein
MRKLLIACLILLGAVSPAFATPAPFTSLSDVPGTVIGGGVCKDGDSVVDVIVIQTTKGDPYQIVLATNGRVIISDLRDGPDTPVWFGTVDEKGNLKITREVKYQEVEGKTLCPYLTERGA